MHGPFRVAHLASAHSVVFALVHRGVGMGVGCVMEAGSHLLPSHTRTWLESWSL